MKINELILEQEQIDELNLKGLGQGLGKAVGAVAGGAVQGAKNIWSGAKQGYQAGQNALKPDGTPATPNTTTPTPAGTSGGGGGYVAGGEVASNNILARARQGTTQDPNAPQGNAPQGNAPQGNAPQSNAPQSNAPQSNAPQGNAQQPAADAAPAEAPAMKSAEIVQGLNDIWTKATANQGSMTGSPQVQQQLIAMAKTAGLAGRKIENRKNNKPLVVEFHSRFLGMVI